MAVFIANFGRGNWAWSECLKRGAIAVMDDARVHPFWLSGDREGYISAAIKYLRLSSGHTPPSAVASRWYNLNSLLHETVDDVWVHREKNNDLWWTVSSDSTPDKALIDDPAPLHSKAKIFIYYKKCSGWSNRNRSGAILKWPSLHPRAKEFLFTEGTFQKLADDHAEYALALINGENLDVWHNSALWRSKLESAKTQPVRYFDSKRRTIARMAIHAWEAIERSGQTATSTYKDKGSGFANRQELELFIAELIEQQGGQCNLTGLQLQLDAPDSDPDYRCSLDRIDSDGDYEPSNLQVVCWFANRWKGISKNERFIQLLKAVRSANC